MKQILIIKISSMGDIIHTLPAVTDAFFAVPNISFDWVIEKSFAEIPRWHPAIDRVISINLRFWKKNWYNFTSWEEYLQYIKLLKERDYDLVIDAQGLMKTSFFVTSIVYGKKYGMDYRSAREPISSYFLNKKYYISKKQHAVKRLRKLFAYSLQYSVPNSVGKYKIDHLFPRKIDDVIPYLIFFHATTQSRKYWIETNWSIIIQYAVDAGYCVKLPCWSRNEMSCSYRLSKGHARVFVLSQLTLQQVAMQISGATAVISIDTGLSHLTAALGCPNLTLYGPTDPYFIGTYGSNQHFLCSQTKKMRHLTAVHVWTIFKNILENHN